MPRVYYNEHDRQKAAWLRVLIGEGLIAPGVVDERSIHDVQPQDLEGFVQCHFFAGIGLWSLCLRRAGWPDDRPVWTGSCPCGPFSAAGKRQGFADPRHLWPEWVRLIRERRPDRIFGEQSDQAVAWLDLVQGDLEGLGYAVGACTLAAGGFGGSHERERIGFVADADNAEWWSERAPWNDGHWPKAGHGSKATVTLDMAARAAAWPTPQFGDGLRGGAESHLDGRRWNLRDFVELAAWATPAWRDYRTPNLEPFAERGGGKQGEQLSNQVIHSGPALIGSSAEIAAGARLNPALARSLMRVPPEWCDCAAMATRSTSKRSRT